LQFTPTSAFFSSTLGGKLDSTPFDLNELGQNESITIDPTGKNQTVLDFTLEPPPGWTRPNGIMIVARNTPLTLNFTPGDTGAPTGIVLYSYAAQTNSTVEIQVWPSRERPASRFPAIP
jgi:hypothetical protein